MVCLGPVGPVGRAEERPSYSCALLATIPTEDISLSPALTTLVSYFPWVPVPGLCLIMPPIHVSTSSCSRPLPPAYRATLMGVGVLLSFGPRASSEP